MYMYKAIWILATCLVRYNVTVPDSFGYQITLHVFVIGSVEIAYIGIGYAVYKTQTLQP
jgi:hypothetical protein